MKCMVPHAVLLCVTTVSAHLLGGFHRLPLSRTPLRNWPRRCPLIEEEKVYRCLNSYFLAFGIDGTKGLPEYYDYLDKINSIAANYGPIGYDIYCDYEFTLESCLGKAMNSSCMNPSAFNDMYNTNDTESINYATSFPVQAYTCLHKDVVKTNFDCSNDVSKNHEQEIRSCYDAMYNELPNSEDTCAAVSTFIHCMEDIYFGYCGEDMKEFICNTQEITFNFDQNNLCKNKLPDCSV